MKQLLKKCVSLTERLAQKAWFSYATILLLQIKVTWAMWHFRDLTSGDTSNYFVNAYGWFEKGFTPISWSPLYVSFYASLLHLSSDVFTVTTLHRWLIVIVLAVLVMALMRRLLPPDLAWLMAAWWVILPINFDALYEVHLFAVIPVLCAALVILSKSGPWCRGVALAILLAASVLVRNELLLASGLLAVMLVAATIWKARHGQIRFKVNRGSILAYGIPLVCACLVIAYFYVRANDAADLSGALERKHTLNICQTYAFGYEQRHTDFTKSPWTECQELMTRVYGKPEPTLLEALVRNPPAMMEHFFWNLRLFPNGLQVLLFNSTFDHVSPDYAPVEQSWMALFWTLVVLAIITAGSIRLIRDRQHWWGAWLKARAWGWLLLITVCCVTAGVMISQRPRPSYMFSLGILLRAAVGMLLLVLMGKSVFRKWLRLPFPVVAILMIALIPSYYATNYQNRPRLLMKGYERLAEYENLLQRPAAVLVSPGYNNELCNYVGSWLR